MSATDSLRLLELIEEGIAMHGGDLGGWTRLTDDALQLFDGRVTLRTELSDPPTSGKLSTVHVHFFSTLHEHEDEVLDACVIGMGDDHDAALKQAAGVWIGGIAGPIKSFIDNKPVCMTCQAGVNDGDVSKGYSHGDYGLPGLRAFVGPSIARFLEDKVQNAIDDTKPWFRFARESAAPRRVHLAKVIITSKGKEGWSRILEIDGHDVSYREPSWPASVLGREFGYLTRYAVFEFPRNSTELSERAELERTIRYFAENFSRYDSVDRLMQEMVEKGYDADRVHEVESISTIAFSRHLFEKSGITYASTIIRARRNNQIEADIPLMSIPAYTRARAIAVELSNSLPKEVFQPVCLYNAESNAILKALNANAKLDLTKITMYPCVVPDRGVSDETMNAALAKLNEVVARNRVTKKKPWWKFW